MEYNGHTLLLIIIIKKVNRSKNSYFGLETFRKEKKSSHSFICYILKLVFPLLGKRRN